MQVKIPCDFCGKKFYRAKKRVRATNFCCREHSYLYFKEHEKRKPDFSTLNFLRGVARAKEM